ncbi:glutamate racemase [Parashewanella spongiae]|uniref:Glutamate racemase n=1 Tax=Parashewanella spongiae TaxID=342950 RepID=A0A3A6U0F4_9GAMM|nr:glutamate racemase [Parashewanella spongiae]MCL1077167.1 glutamate racemase [Parashewanella spongiae]RJY18809.1 glutamate racemase [Parashewanella spongiae]
MSQPILVFDSGIGGLTVLSEIKQRLPQQNYHYLFDNLRLPYGELDDQELIEGVVTLIADTVSSIDACLVVIACNTASTLVLSHLRNQLSVPIVGVVPAIKPAAVYSKTKCIALLATPATITRQYTKDLIAEFAGDCQVISVASSEMVHMAEDKLNKKEIDQEQLQTVLAPIKESCVDVLVLGCTHFPLLKTEITEILDDEVLLMDSGKAIARRVETILVESFGSKKSGVTESANLTAWYTSKQLSHELTETLFEYGFKKISPINE